jgi:transposase
VGSNDNYIDCKELCRKIVTPQMPGSFGFTTMRSLLVASQQLLKNRWIERVNSLGIDVGKKKCRAALKDERGDIIREFFFSNNNEGISTLIRSASHYGKCTAVLESTGNMWIRIHDTILANPYKTKIIAEAKIKSDKLDARILADLLRADLVYESYVPAREFREKRSLVRHRISLVRNRTMLENKVHSLLDKYDYKSELETAQVDLALIVLFPL